MDDETLKPITNGLFCERIFGPVNDWECLCKNYKRPQKKTSRRKKVNICSRCKVEITESKIRNYRMG